VRPERPRTPPWLGAPRGTLPGVVALEFVLARTTQVAVCVTRVGAYPSGFELELVTMAGDETEELDPLLFHGRRLRGRHQRESEQGIPDEMLRFGVEFADGAKATNTADQQLARLAGGTSHVSSATKPSKGEQTPAGPVLHTGSGGGGGGHWRQNIWIWPLPPPGRLTFVCQWPEASIALTRHDVDAQLIRDAATRSQAVLTDA
jgi:hypothetical protein